MRCINSLIRPTFFLYSQNQKAFTSPFPSWDLQRVEPGDNQSETANLWVPISAHVVFSFFFGFVLVSFFLLKLYICWNLKSSNHSGWGKDLQKKNLEMAWQNPGGHPCWAKLSVAGADVCVTVGAASTDGKMLRTLAWPFQVRHISSFRSTDIYMQKLEHLRI